MPTFTGYEPKNPGKGLSSGPRGGALAPTAASAAADAAMLPVSSDSLSRELSGLLSVTIDEEGFLEPENDLSTAAPPPRVAPWDETLVSTSTTPIIFVPQSGAGGNSLASPSYNVPVVPKETAEVKHAAVANDLRAQLNDTSGRLQQSRETILEFENYHRRSWREI